MSSFLLKLVGIICMTFDHTRALVFNTSEFGWMQLIGRFAFPIFAFQIVMGYRKTKSLKKYIFRLLLFAVISEIPFKMMLWLAYKDLRLALGSWNVYWTFIVGLIALVVLNDKKIKSLYKFIIVLALNITFTIIYVDYAFYGICIMIAYYYLFPFKDTDTNQNKEDVKIVIQNQTKEIKNESEIGKKPTNKSVYLFIVLACLAIIIMSFMNIKSGFTMSIVSVLNYAFFTFVGSLIPFFSNGKKGFSNKFVKWLFYIYYPLHIAILCLINYFR